MTYNTSELNNALTNKYLYNGVEKENLTNWHETNYRLYDSETGRFLRLDPLSMLIPGISTYHFAYNNPVTYNDPQGLIGQHRIVPGSGNHWSDKFRSDEGNEMLMSNSTFNRFYNKNHDNYPTPVHNQTRRFETAKKLGTAYQTVLNPWGGEEVSRITTAENRVQVTYAGEYYLVPLKGVEQSGGSGSDLVRDDGVNPFQIAWGVNGVFQMGTEIAVHGPKPKYTGPGDWANQVKLGKNFTKKLGVVGIGITLTDAAVQGQWQNHHTADVAIGVLTTFVIVSNPVTATIVGGYFLLDLGVQVYSGRSITEHLFDPTPIPTRGPK